jgi:hypothetical protein
MARVKQCFILVTLQNERNKTKEHNFKTYISHSWMTGVRFLAGELNFSLPIKSKPDLGHIQPPIQWIPALSSKVKRLGGEADQSRQSSANVKNVWSYNSIPPYIFMARCVVKHRIYFHGVVFTEAREQI